MKGHKILTDVIQRNYKPSYELVSDEAPDKHKTRVDPIFPGASVSHFKGTAGTIGMIVFKADDGVPCVLSNWHVLHGPEGKIGDQVVQPGPHDNDNVDGNSCGELLCSHLGVAGDCALARIRGRSFDRTIYGLDVIPVRMANVDLDDKVVKFGRTTATTYGIRTPYKCCVQNQVPWHRL